MAKITKSELLRLQNKLKTDEAIGARFGITRQAVHQLRRKYGIPSTLVENPTRNEEIIKKYEAGKTGVTLAKEYNLSVSQTYRIIKEHLESKNGKSDKRTRKK